IGEEYVRRELEFIPATCKVIEYYSQSYGCLSCKEGLGDTEKRKDSAIRKKGRTRRYGKACDRKVSGAGGSGWKRSCFSIHCCMDYVSEVCQWSSALPAGEGLEPVWGSDQPHYPCQLDYLLFTELFPANV